MDPPALPWSIAWFSALVDRERGELDAAMANLRRLAATEFEEARTRGFDFSKDDRLLRMLADTLLLQASAANDASARKARLDEARSWVGQALELDVQNAESWYLLAQIEQAAGLEAAAAEALAEHAKYKPDDNARDRAVALARQRYPAANHAAEAVVIHDLQREGAFGLETPSASSPASDAPLTQALAEPRP
jgi:tetratricopeptide (TPR) repeat protein